MGVRAALGAGRGRLFSCCSSKAPADAPSAARSASSWRAAVSRDAGCARSQPSGRFGVTLDARVVGSRSRCPSLTALVFGLVPLAGRRAARSTELLREGGSRSTSGARQHRLQATLVVSSVALAFVLLAGAGLLIRSFDKLMAADAGSGALECADHAG